jgi:hypothetical protein
VTRLRLLHPQAPEDERARGSHKKKEPAEAVGGGSDSGRAQARPDASPPLWAECTLQMYFIGKGRIDYFVVQDKEEAEGAADGDSQVQSLEGPQDYHSPPARRHAGPMACCLLRAPRMALQKPQSQSSS